MSSSQKLHGYLPALYRPEPNQDSLMRYFLDSLGASMDLSREQMTLIMQAHWYKFADSAAFDPHAIKDREHRDLPPFNVRDTEDKREIARYPYITDLARLGNLVSIFPWKEPPNQRDLVENYRRRIAKIIGIYRNGLGTLDALRAMTEAELPWDIERPLAQQIRSFSIEEGVSLETQVFPVVMNGEPSDKVGALMRWKISRGDALPTTPTILIHGLAPVEDTIEATESPMVELYQPKGDSLIGKGPAYRGTIPDGKCLRMSPSRRSFLIGASGVMGSPLSSMENRDQDPSANGPWEVQAGSPEVIFNCVFQTDDGSLWLGGEGQLWRFNGTEFTPMVEDVTLGHILSLFEFEKKLFLGTENGLKVTDLYPSDGIYAVSAVGEEEDEVAVNGIQLKDGDIWLSTQTGPRKVKINNDNSMELDDPLFGLETFCRFDTQTETYFGCELGLLRQDLTAGEWYAYRGETDEEPQKQWLKVDLGALPETNSLYMAPVKSIEQTPDQSLWLGTDHGLARYYARHERDLLYRTVLEGYTDLITGAVHHIHADDRGILWVASDQGLFRYDGRDIAQYQFDDNHWLQMGRADSIYPNEIDPVSRGRWRFNKIETGWEQYDSRSTRWANSSLDVRSNASQEIRRIVFCESIIAELGAWDGSAFTTESPVPDTDLAMRCKPDQEVIVDGGIPHIPRLPSGNSTWRYLQLEQEVLDVPTDLPWWSREGRLFPPPEIDDVYPGRYRNQKSSIDGRFDESVFAYCPSAMVTMIYDNPLAMAVCVRIFKRDDSDSIDPVIIDRVYRGINQVRPAGVPVKLAVEGKLIYGATP